MAAVHCPVSRHRHSPQARRCLGAKVLAGRATVNGRSVKSAAQVLRRRLLWDRWLCAGWARAAPVHCALLCCRRAVPYQLRAVPSSICGLVSDGMANAPSIVNDGAPAAPERPAARHLAASIASDDNDEQEQESQTLHSARRGRPPRQPAIGESIPQVGCGRCCRWGTYKTFTLFDLAHSIMAGAPVDEF